MNSSGKKILSLTVALSLFLPISGSTKRNKNDRVYHDFTIVKGSIKYSKGTIYIGSRFYLSRLKDVEEDDILVIDSRKSVDPDVRIKDSYKVTNPETREEIIDALLEYEDKFPTNWERSRITLIREWYAHNVMYRLGQEHGSTKDVDFNNDDEITYTLRK